MFPGSGIEFLALKPTYEDRVQYWFLQSASRTCHHATSINDLNELYVSRQWLDGMRQKYVLGGLDWSTGQSENQALSKGVNKALHLFGTKFGGLHVSSQQLRKEFRYIIGDLDSIFSKVCWLWRPRHGILGLKNGLWVLGKLGEWLPLLRGHSLSFGVLTVVQPP